MNNFFFFFGFEETLSPESVFCRPRWASKTPAVPDSYKRCTPWLELEICCAGLDSNSRSAVQVSSFLPSRYAPWELKTPAVPDSYKRCMLWLELETCCADLKPFAVTLRSLRTLPSRYASFLISLKCFIFFGKYFYH